MSLKEIAKETLSILKRGAYENSLGEIVTIAAAQQQAEEDTALYQPSDADRLLAVEPCAGRTVIEVTDETTQVAAHRLVTGEGVDDLILLNYASARNPGGGFINGAKAQEEDLARCSGLYPCLLTQPAYFEANRATESMVYTDHAIYSPSVPWFRTRSTNMIDRPFLASVISAPAPNAGEALRRDADAGPAIERTLRRRAGMVLGIAKERGHRNLLLGAWGCGVFRNDPTVVADAFGSWLEGAFTGHFQLVAFAVLDRSKNRATLRAFQARFGDVPKS